MGNSNKKPKCPDCVPAHYFQNQSALIEHILKGKHSQRLNKEEPKNSFPYRTV